MFLLCCVCIGEVKGYCINGGGCCVGRGGCHVDGGGCHVDWGVVVCRLREWLRRWTGLLCMWRFFV